ncbi:MAG: phosphatase PAP2 family protein [Candidatus Saccharibacteria bacterium]
MRNNIWRLIGVAGTIVCAGLFIIHPSWPTPDKLIIFLTFVFMTVGQAKEMLKHLLPFVALLLVYESFRGLVPQLNSHVNYMWMVSADKFLFGRLPTHTLQNWWWHGAVQWFDFIFYLAYMLHFIIPISLALLIWKYREKSYWQYVSTYLVVSFFGFLTFLIFPAAPPWLASDKGLIQPITRVSSYIFGALGVQNFPSVYNKISPNPVAAVPSLHAAYATLLVIFVYKLFGWRWALLACIYPLLIFVGTVYMGEHYAIDEILGIVYAVGAYLIVSWIFSDKVTRTIKQRLSRA